MVDDDAPVQVSSTLCKCVCVLRVTMCQCVQLNVVWVCVSAY